MPYSQARVDCWPLCRISYRGKRPLPAMGYGLALECALFGCRQSYDNVVNNAGFGRVIKQRTSETEFAKNGCFELNKLGARELSWMRKGNVEHGLNGCRPRRENHHPVGHVDGLLDVMGDEQARM